ASKARFLDPDSLGGKELGQTFALIFSSGLSRVFVAENFLGIKGTHSQIDTGDNSDGGLSPVLFQRALDERRAILANRVHAGGRQARLKAGVFGNESYPKLWLWEYWGENMIGLRFLARHMVTFNFPKRTMY